MTGAATDRGEKKEEEEEIRRGRAAAVRDDRCTVEEEDEEEAGDAQKKKKKEKSMGRMHEGEKGKDFSFFFLIYTQTEEGLFIINPNYFPSLIH